MTLQRLQEIEQHTYDEAALLMETVHDMSPIVPQLLKCSYILARLERIREKLNLIEKAKSAF